jgi:4'-phosphopantetheinyl transferase
MVLYGAQGLTQRSQAYQLLALAAEEHWGMAQLPPILREARGKPRFDGGAGREFNLSHSGPLALCALDHRPVGVDVQLIKAWRPALMRRVCSPRELAWVEAGPDCHSRFTQLWALKESRAKQDGAGLTRPIANIRVPLPDGLGGPMEADGLWFQTYSGPSWRGAVCGQTPPPQEIFWLCW